MLFGNKMASTIFEQIGGTYTQVEFAKKLGVPNKSVSRWETEKNMSDMSLLLPICDVFDISVNELIIGERIPTQESKN